MKLKEIGKDIYDVDVWIDEGIGAPNVSLQPCDLTGERAGKVPRELR